MWCRSDLVIKYGFVYAPWRIGETSILGHVEDSVDAVESTER
ncbi:MAG: hypothetical protein O7F08_03705 [Deltaproteobacteria bacterium]|nr:hypothetical protein [Deltaproteobacteria bacterium]